MNPQTMQAVISTKYGGPEIFQVQKVNKPVPSNNEVLVKIHAASVTTAETMMRTGYPLIGRLFMGFSKPKHAISGTGFAGEIEAVGAAVKLFKVGDKVFGESLEKFGTYAEYVCIDEEGIITLKPDNITYEEAAVVGDGHITSMNFLKNITKIQAGQTILINGASGSLGTAAIQLAKYFGAEVTGVCSTANVELVKSLGADKVIDYTKEDFTQNGQTYDIIYDAVGKSSFSKCKNSLTEKGIYTSPVLRFSLLFQMLKTSIIGSKKATFSATGLLPYSKIKSFLQEIKELMEVGLITTVIDRDFSLEGVADAHRYIEKGHKKGNVIIKLV